MIRVSNHSLDQFGVVLDSCGARRTRVLPDYVRQYRRGSDRLDLFARASSLMPHGWRVRENDTA